MRSRGDDSARRRERAVLAARIRSIREDLGGGDQGQRLAEQLAVTHQTWINYERGGAIPGHVLLSFLSLSGADPHWLLEGEGQKYRQRPR